MSAFGAFVGSMYDDGRGVAKDQSKALKWWTAAAEQGHAPAQLNLGTYLLLTTNFSAYVT